MVECSHNIVEGESVSNLLIALSLLVLFAPGQRSPQVPVGAIAPTFTVADDGGKQVSLADYRGKFVVLEWHEKGCPYVTKHYRGGDMQARQKRWMDKGVVWLLINSSAEGFHSYLTPEESRAYAAGLKAEPPMLLDTTGTVGKAYGVTTALHMVIINPTGKVVYNGAIDDQPKTEAASLAGAKNYVDTALAELLAGRAVTTPSSQPYGCEVHYKAGR
jgi:peroxiredoxin